jgi:dihydroorotase-like cyclic amidohydrolase
MAAQKAILRIRNGTIAEIGPNLTAAAGARVIEAKGMLVLPGGIDPHVHLAPTRTTTTLKDADDYTSGSELQITPANRVQRSDCTKGGPPCLRWL